MDFGCSDEVSAFFETAIGIDKFFVGIHSMCFLIDKKQSKFKNYYDYLQ